MIADILLSFPDVLAMLPLVDVVACGVVLLALGFLCSLVKEEHI